MRTHILTCLHPPHLHPNAHVPRTHVPPPAHTSDSRHTCTSVALAHPTLHLHMSSSDPCRACTPYIRPTSMSCTHTLHALPRHTRTTLHTRSRVTNHSRPHGPSSPPTSHAAFHVTCAMPACAAGTLRWSPHAAPTLYTTCAPVVLPLAHVTGPLVSHARTSYAPACTAGPLNVAHPGPHVAHDPSCHTCLLTQLAPHVAHGYHERSHSWPLASHVPTTQPHFTCGRSHSWSPHVARALPCLHSTNHGCPHDPIYTPSSPPHHTRPSMLHALCLLAQPVPCM